MNAIIIAAGSGKRISKDIESTPKSLININGKPIIDYQIEILRRLKIKNIEKPRFLRKFSLFHIVS